MRTQYVLGRVLGEGPGYGANIMINTDVWQYSLYSSAATQYSHAED